MSNLLFPAARSVPASHPLTQILRTFRERLLSGFSWTLLSAVALQGSVLLSSIVVARLLGLAPFGAYALLTATVMSIAMIGQGSFGLVASKFVGENLAADPQRVARVLRMCQLFTLAAGTLTTVLVFALARVLAADLLGRPELEPLVRVVAVAIFFQVSAHYQYGALQGFGAFRELSRGGVVAGLAHLVFTATGAWIGQVQGALIGFVLASAARMLVLGFLLGIARRAHGIPARATLERADVQMIWRFALPAGLAGFVTMPCLWLVTVVIARLPDGLAWVGIFAVAHQLRLAVLQLPALLNAVSFSVLSRLKGQNEGAGFRGVFWTNLWLNLAFATLVVGVMLVAAEPLLRLYGRDFAAGRWVLVLLLVSVLPELLALSIYQLVQSAGRMWHSLFLIVTPRDLLYLGVAALLVPAHGIVAAAAAYLLAHTVGLLATLLTARRYAADAVWPQSGR